MKIRQGFVSNSSSSSFIVGYNKHNVQTTCPTCGHKIGDIIPIIQSLCNDDNDDSFNQDFNIDDLIIYVSQCDDKWSKQFLNKLLDIKNTCDTIIRVGVSYSNSRISQLIVELEKNPEYIVLMEDD